MSFRHRPGDSPVPMGSGVRSAAGVIFFNGANGGLSPDPSYHVLVIGFVLIAAAAVALVLILLQFSKLRKEGRELRIRNEKQKNYFSDVDALTGLPNRNGVKRMMSDWVDLCRRNGKDGGAFFLDVDNFRSVNNTFGHDAGDKFLCETSLRLRRVAGKRNIVGRIGGDEFALFISDVNRVEQLEGFAKKIADSFREPYLINGIVIQLTCSVGAILFRYREAKRKNEFDEIINRGEFVLKEAKTSKRGSYALFNNTFGGLIDRQLQLESALKYSIESDELTCYLQPQYNTREKAIVGFESLARWKSARFGMIPPSQFIPMAEKSGFIKELGRFVVEKTFYFAKSVEGRGVRVSFNTSPIELLQANFTDYIISRFDYYGLAPDSVAIEITESCLIESFDEVIRKLKILSGHGIQVYLDDFGTGFSSLTYLKNLPINSVKIDKSFIDEIVTDHVEKDIVDMIILLARRLNLEVIAEGVETKEQLECISESGCDIIQGYYISRPVPQGDAMPLLESRQDKLLADRPSRGA